MLLDLVNHSRPDSSSAVRELSKVFDAATQANGKALLRAINYVLDTEFYCLKMKPLLIEIVFYLKGKSDSEYAGDRYTRISVYGYILYFCGAPISWKSKSGKSATLSSMEAEYFAMSKIAKKVIAMRKLLESIGIKYSTPLRFIVIMLVLFI
jgi:hypothetical protein